jgi:ABC-2 type transport system permease protein
MMDNNNSRVPVLAPRRRAAVSPRRILSALGVLFWLTLRQHVRGRRLLVLSAMFALPILIALIAPRSAGGKNLEMVLIFNLLPQALVPLAALLYASGMIQDEIEEQTLTYLLVRPLPRWALYVTKLLATLVVTIVLTSFFTMATYLAIYWGSVLPARVLQTPVLMALAVVAYCSVFGCISLFARHTLVAGLAYIILLEGLLANLDMDARMLTVIYYFRTLSERWFDVHVPNWSIHLDKAPAAGTCVLVLLSVSVVAAAAAALRFATREFRMKTPEGS